MSAFRHAAWERDGVRRLLSVTSSRFEPCPLQSGYERREFAQRTKLAGVATASFGTQCHSGKRTSGGTVAFATSGAIDAVRLLLEFRSLRASGCGSHGSDAPIRNH